MQTYEQTLAQLHNLYGRQHKRCPKASDITLRSMMDIRRHLYSSSNGAVRTWIPRSMRVVFFQPECNAPIFLGTFCRVVTLSTARASMSQDSHDPRRA
jgi:hypothetical protein